MGNYTILHCHTMLSNGVTNIDSVTSYDQYIKQAHEWGMKAMALSEHGSVFQFIKKKLCMEEHGMKFIAAEEFYVTQTLSEKIRDNYHCLLIAKNYDGVLELNKLSSKSFNRDDNSFYYAPRITIEDVKGTSDDIIVSTACLGGIINKAPDSIRDDFIRWMTAHKDRCFLEIQPHLDENQIAYNQYLWELSKKTGIPLLMCTDTHALNAAHVEGRRILQKAKDIHFDGEDKLHLEMLSYDELVGLCRQQDALPMNVYLDAIEMTNTVADMVEPFELDYSYKYPHLWGDDSEKVLRAKIAEGIKWRGVDKLPNYQEYLDRIEYEMKAYVHNGAIDFMLLMEDIISWCRTQDIQIGYGRGSCTGSLIAYLLGITEMDSVKYGLNFDRFMNVERVSLSDIDSDIAPNRIDEVKDYVFNKHGLYCADIITFNTIALKGAIRDVGRALEMPLHDVSEICNNVDGNEEKYRGLYPELFKYVDIVNGCVVSIGNHPSGMIVAPHSIDDRMGLCTTSTDTVPISQINMKEVDLQNYVKLDLLKLVTIQIINDACKLIGIDRLTPDNMDVNDAAVWRSIRDDTTAIFQLESQSAQQYVKKLLSDETIAKLRKFQPNIDYITLLSMGNGAIRPAGASYRDELANGDVRTYGNEAIDKFMSKTFGFLIFQCQIIEFLHQYCGYTMGEADVVRRHFAKKIGTDKDIPQIKAGFAKTMAEHYGMSKDESEKTIADFIRVIEDASNYLFSLNHSQPYSYEGYAEGWLRYYYPLQFLTICLNAEQDDEEKTNALTAYAHKVGIKIKSPKFRHSHAEYFCDTKENVIYKGLSSIKNMSASTAEALYSMRDMKFKNFAHFLFALQDVPGKPDSRQLDILIKIGFFDEFAPVNVLLKAVEIFNKYHKCKTIKVEQWLSNNYPLDILCKISEKVTEKTASGINNYAAVIAALRSTDFAPTIISDRIKWQVKYLGYSTLSDQSANTNDWVVVLVDVTKYGTANARLYNIVYGVERTYKCNKKYWASHPFQAGDVIRASIDDKPKYKKGEDGGWVKTGETEKYLKLWAIMDQNNA